MNERVPLHGHYLIIVSGGLGTRVTVACPDCGLRYGSMDDTRDCGVRGALDDFLRAASVAGRALAGLADPTCEGVRLQRLAEDVMES